jgi:Zn-dependent M28 family amino/carboxypeptidase
VPDTIQTLKGVVESLAPLERRAGSEEERQAAEWLADRLESASAPASIDEEWFYDGYAKQLLPLGMAGGIAGLLAATGRRRFLGALLGAAAAVAIVDDVSNGTRIWRKRIESPKRTWNVVAEVGPPDAQRTLVVLAHHDAAPTGILFDQTLATRLAEKHPERVERQENSVPVWWPSVAAPVLGAVASLVGSRRLGVLGAALSAFNVGLAADLARNRIVPGANDNLSGAAALVALAEQLRESPLTGVRTVLASCGAEEVLQGGIYGFAERHLSRLPQDRTWVLNLDTIGSPALVMLEGEGAFRIEDYTDPDFRDLVARAAERTGVSLHRGARSRASTDSVIPSRAGFPTATLISWDPRNRLPTNYHLMSDTPDNVHYDTVAQAVRLSYAVAEELAAG